MWKQYCSSAWKPCTCCQTPFYPHAENAFYVGAGLLPGRPTYRLRYDLRKTKSLYGNLKQKKGERSKAGEFKASQGWSDSFRKRSGLKSVRITREAASADHKAVRSSQAPLRKSLRNNICLKRFQMQMKVPYFGGEKNATKDIY